VLLLDPELLESLRIMYSNGGIEECILHPHFWKVMSGCQEALAEQSKNRSERGKERNPYTRAARAEAEVLRLEATGASKGVIDKQRKVAEAARLHADTSHVYGKAIHQEAVLLALINSDDATVAQVAAQRKVAEAARQHADKNTSRNKEHNPHNVATKQGAELARLIKEGGCVGGGDRSSAGCSSRCPPARRY
jgi:hypothetical protein